MFEQPSSIKDINRLRILNLLRVQIGVSRTELAAQTGLAKATISQLVAELIDDGIAFEDGTRPRPISRGRRPIRLSLTPEFRLAIGVELTGTECAAMLTDLYADPLRVVRLPMTDPSIRTAVELVAEAISELMENRSKDELLGVCVGVPGPVDATRQHVVQAENLGWYDVPLAPMLESKIGVPVWLVKRTNAGAVGEYWHGEGRGHENLVYVSLDIGVGSGIIINGQLYEGHNGSAGEIGHVTVVPNGAHCVCGNFGCLETVASSSAIAARAKHQWERDNGRPVLSDRIDAEDRSVTSRGVIAAAARGDAQAGGVVRYAAQHLGIALSAMINLFNPSLVLLSGEMLQAPDLFLETIRDVVDRSVFTVPAECVEILPSSLGSDAAAIGAASLVLDEFFSTEHIMQECVAQPEMPAKHIPPGAWVSGPRGASGGVGVR